MSRSFTKVFSSITESTVWCEAHPIRIVWICMLAMADRHGRVWASIPGLANRARVTLEEAEEAINRFLSPDKYSRTPDYDGRRIEPIDGGWRLLNHSKYREMQDEADKREADAERQRRHRAAMSHVEPSRNVTPVTPSHNDSQRVAQAEAEAEAGKEEQRPRKRGSRLPKPMVLTPEWKGEAAAIVVERGAVGRVLVEGEWEKFCDHFWAKAGADAVKMDWLGTWRNWIRKACDWSGANGKADRKLSHAEETEAGLARLRERLANEA